MYIANILESHDSPCIRIDQAFKYSNIATQKKRMSDKFENLLPEQISKNRENIQLIWLDANLRDTRDVRLTKSMLVDLNASVQFYTDVELCVRFIKSIRNEQIFLIVSGGLARQILSILHEHSLLIAVFIFCGHRQYHENLLEQYEKLFGIFTKQNELLTAIRRKIDLVEKYTIAFNLFDQKQKSIKDLSKDSASFLWHQLLIYILKQIPQDQQSKQQMIDLCSEYYHNNKQELMKINQFQDKYQSADALKWYTDECFLYRLVNKALRTEDVELLYIFRFFLIDLCSTIDEHRLQPTNEQKHVQVYRGTQISDDEFEKFQFNIGQVIATNGFLSTSKNRRISIDFAKPNRVKKGFHSVLFEIDVDLSKNTISCVDLSRTSLFADEEEILFNLNSTFQIHNVLFDEQARVWRIQLHNTDHIKERIDEYLQLAQKTLENSSPMIYFGYLLWKYLGSMSQAKKYFSMLLKSLAEDHQDIHDIHHHLGNIFREEHDYNLALNHYEKSFEIRQQQFPSNDPYIAASYATIGLTYRMKNDPDRAIDYYRKASQIYKMIYQSDHVSLATVLDGIGSVYFDKKRFEKALKYQTKALEMYKRVLPKDHLDIARCLGNIGLTYEHQEQFSKALEIYHQVLKMQQHSLPLAHPNLCFTFNRIVSMYAELKQFDCGLKFCKEQLREQIQHLGENHISIAQTLTTMGNLVGAIDYTKALTYFQQALDISTLATPVDHMSAITCLKSMAMTYGQNELFEQSIEQSLKALELARQYLSAEHIELAEILHGIAYAYETLENFDQAISYYNQCSLIYQANYGLQHEIVQEIKQNVERLDQLLAKDLTVSF